MRVLVLTSLFPNNAQPHKAPFNRQQIESLATMNEVRVISPVPFHKAWRSFSNLRGRAGSVIGAENEAKFEVSHPTYVFTPKVLRGLYGSFYLRSVRSAFARAVDEFRPEVVLGCWAYPDGWAAMHLARRYHLPVALKIQGSDVLQVESGGVRSRRVAEALAGVDAVVAVSAHLAERAIAMGAPRDRVHTVYNGVDTTRFCPGDRDQARQRLGLNGHVPLITFVGNMVPVKGVDILLRALDFALRRGAKFRCVLVGDGPQRREYERMVVRGGLSEVVRFAGSCPLEEMPLWHRASDLLVLSSRSEGIPNVLREAQACGTPFLATRVGGVPEIALPSCLVPPNDPETLAQRLVEHLARTPRGDDVHPFASEISPASWLDSATELSRVLRGIVGAQSERTRRAA